MRLAILMTCLLTATAAAGDFAGPCTALADGATVRIVLRDGTLVEGRAAGWDGLRLHVLDEDTAAGYAAVDVQALWVRNRHTGGGAKAGGLIGASGGAAFFTLLALILDSMDDDGVFVPGAALAGGLLGGGGGALIGAIVGSAFPDWELLYGDGTLGDEPTRFETGRADRRLGGLAAGGGLAWTAGQDDPGLSCRFGLTTRAFDRFELELLGATHRLGPARRQSVEPAGLPAPTPPGVTTVWQAGAELRLPFTHGPVRPYAAAGLAGYGWQETFLGLSWGGGLAVDLSDRLSGRLDYRHHDSIQNLTETDPEFESLTASLVLAW
jgi:opacity protein-like surface antigen